PLMHIPPCGQPKFEPSSHPVAAQVPPMYLSPLRQVGFGPVQSAALAQAAPEFPGMYFVGQSGDDGPQVLVPVMPPENPILGVKWAATSAEHAAGGGLVRKRVPGSGGRPSPPGSVGPPPPPPPGPVPASGTP